MATTNKKLNPKKVIAEFDKRAIQRKGAAKVLSDRFGLKLNEEFDEECREFINKQFTKKMNKVLDVGIGIGRLARAYSAKCDGLIGVDFSDKMLEVASTYLADKKNTTLIYNDILELDFLPKYFDLGIVSLVLKHNNDKRALQIIRKLKKWCKQIFLIEHISDKGSAPGSEIAVMRASNWYIDKFAPMKPTVLHKTKRANDNIVFVIFK